MKEKEATRINKYLSEIGYCSRRAADKLIEEKRVFVNGLIPEMGTKVSDSDEIVVDGVRITKTDIKPIYIAFNKPIGIVCTTDTGVEKDNIIDYINFPSRIFPIGRLDKNSHGLIFLTNDGDIVNKILRAGNQHEKEYMVSVNKPIDIDFINRMRSGVRILGTVTQKCFVKKETDRRFRIILTQGLNRQIRRMCEALDYEVESLQRIRIMNIQLTGLPVGKWRYFTPAEMETIHAMVANSSKTADGSDGMDE